ncbi:MAG: cation transporter [Pseudomonadales bacterium]
MSDGCCQTTLDPRLLRKRERRVLIAVLAINVATFVMMVAAAIVSGSSALLSGALDNLGDSITYALSFAVVGASAAMKARVAFFKGLLILGAAMAVAGQIAWRLFNVEAPIFEVMGLAAVLNLAANSLCLALLHPHRHGDVNMESVWECSRNDVFEGFAVIAAALLVWALGSGWPDILIACALLVLFLRSAARVLRRAWRELNVAEPA